MRVTLSRGTMRMPQQRTDDWQACTAGYRDTGKAMPEIVQPHVPKTRNGSDAIPDLGVPS